MLLCNMFCTAYHSCGGIKMRLACVFLLTLLVATTRAQVPRAGHQVDLDIRAGPLDQALTDLGLQTGLTVIVGSGTHAERIFTPGLKGSFAPEDALQKLLARTGLRAESLREGAFEVTVQERVKPLPLAKPVQSTGLSNALEEVEIFTGSYIRKIPPDVSSLSTYSREDIERSGAATVEQFVRGIPQNFALLNSQTSTAGISPQAIVNVSRGAGIDLRGLGSGATLVLLDGQRLAPGGLDGSFVDISMVPLAALERVDVLTDGASAIYGSDAVAGVVNLVMRRDFVGWETMPYYGYATGGGARERGLSQLAGNDWPNGGAMVAYENYQQQAVDASSRHTLVPQPGLYQVIPSQARQSAVLRLHEEVAAGTELLADARYSERDFAQDYLSGQLANTQARGRAQMMGASFTAVHLLPRQWHSDLIGAYAGEEEAVTTSVSTIAQSFETRSSVASIDWRFNGPVMSAPGGPFELSLGASLRWEAFSGLARPGPPGTDLKREVLGAYGEAFVPIVGEGNALPWTKRIELSLAVRHDDYRNGEAQFASAASDNPKIGVLWSPRAGLILRGSYATSFRIASLPQTNGATDTALLLPLPNPTRPVSEINTLYITGGNASLRPEAAKSFTAGVEFKPGALPGASFSATYFHTDYGNRIAAPPVIGPVTSVYAQLDTLRPYINSAPSAADIQRVYGEYAVLDPTHIGPAGVQAIFDSRLQNIAKTEASGVDVRVESNVRTYFGDLNFLLQGQYLAQLSTQPAPTTSYVSGANAPFSPPRVRMQANMSWSASGWTASTTLDYTGSYRDTLVAGDHTVGSWFTVDGRVAYETGRRFASTPLENATVAISVSNLMNHAVPSVEGLADQTLGYDPSNASPLGRSILFQVKKRW
jgi:iron complex outermembrane receptor protein